MENGFDNVNDYMIFLKQTFQKFFLNKDDMCGLLGISMSSLDRRIKSMEDIPRYKKEGSSKTSAVQFHIKDVAQYLFDNERGTAIKFD